MNVQSRTLFAILTLILVVFSTGCDVFSSKDDDAGFVSLHGQVLNEATNNPVLGARIEFRPTICYLKLAKKADIRLMWRSIVPWS